MKTDHQTHIYTVAELTEQIKTILEQNFLFVWLGGEISNFRVPASGHYYFTLKDDQAQIQAVMFRGQNRNLKFVPEDGMSVTGLGRISVYEPRGTYQIILEHLEPLGVGPLQVAFEQLKRKLSAEGLFDDHHKKPIPVLPQKIGLITSPSGAAVHDVVRIAQRRFPGLPLTVIPTKVQGESAPEEIAAAIELAGSRGDIDLIILARGGGSLEDLQAFNSEAVARAVFACRIPIVSAIGHETDFTIADFVADLRAPTPSAAAELAIPLKRDFQAALDGLQHQLVSLVARKLEKNRDYLKDLSKQLRDPQRKIDDHRLKLDDHTTRLTLALTGTIKLSREKFGRLHDHLLYINPMDNILKSKHKLNNLTEFLVVAVRKHLQAKSSINRESRAKLNALNPTAILSRGFSITRTIPEAVIIRDSATVRIGQKVEVLLANGSLTCRIKEKKT